MHIDTLEKLNDARNRKQPVVLVTFLDGNKQGLYFQDGTVEGLELSESHRLTAAGVSKSNQCLINEDERIFFQPFNPPLRMIIIGAVHITQNLVDIARQCGYQVSVIDPRQAFATASRFPDVELVTDWPDKALETLEPDMRTAIITLTHDPKLDDPALDVALNSNAFYIGALGSQKTQGARLKRLRERGFSEQQYSRIHGPIGLDIGAKSPAEIAVSIMAEITASLHK